MKEQAKKYESEYKTFYLLAAGASLFTIFSLPLGKQWSCKLSEL